MSVIINCKKCKYYADSNLKMKGGDTKEVMGDYCLRFGWNLGRYKNWVRKDLAQTGDKLPSMSKIPKGCFK